jgi:hypothetical protein
MMGGVSALQDGTLALGLTMRGIALASPLITSDGTARWLAALLLVHALVHCVPLVAEMLFGV